MICDMTLTEDYPTGHKFYGKCMMCGKKTKGGIVVCGKCSRNY
jgi:hypothetical protein